jgi:hypothetical protein
MPPDMRGVTKPKTHVCYLSPIISIHSDSAGIQLKEKEKNFGHEELITIHTSAQYIPRAAGYCVGYYFCKRLIIEAPLFLSNLNERYYSIAFF